MDPAFAKNAWLTQGKDKVLEIFAQHRASLDLDLIDNAIRKNGRHLREGWEKFMQEILEKGLVKPGTKAPLVQTMIRNQRKVYKSKAKRIHNMEPGVAWSEADIAIIQAFAPIPGMTIGTEAAGNDDGDNGIQAAEPLPLQPPQRGTAAPKSSTFAQPPARSPPTRKTTTRNRGRNVAQKVTESDTAPTQRATPPTSLAAAQGNETQLLLALSEAGMHGLQPQIAAAHALQELQAGSGPSLGQQAVLQHISESTRAAKEPAPVLQHILEPIRPAKEPAPVLQHIPEPTRLAKEPAPVQRGPSDTALKARADVLVALVNQHPAWSPEQLRQAVDLLLPHTI